MRGSLAGAKLRARFLLPGRFGAGEPRLVYLHQDRLVVGDGDRFGFAVEPFTCTADAVATFSETPVAVGVRLELDERVRIVSA